MEEIAYTPTLTGKHFILDYVPGTLFYDWIVGPLGSGKTTADFMKLIYMAQLQARGADGTRKTRCAIVRNTAPQLKDTTMKSWFNWFEPGVAGTWHATDKIFDLKFGDVECEVMFRALDTAEDVARVLSLELTFAIVDEFREVPRPIIDALSGRLGRYPSKRHGGATNHGMWGASNPGTEDVWWYEHLHDPKISETIQLYGPTRELHLAKLRNRPASGITTRYFHQPGGMSPHAENLENLPPYEHGNRSYYINQCVGKTPSWIKQYVDAEWGFSASETPVVKTFSADLHVAKSTIKFTPMLKLVGGMDPGLAGTRVTFGQEDLYGRLLVMGEVGATGMGVSRFIHEKLRPYLNTYFPDADFVLAPDPASANRSQVSETTSVLIELRKYFQIKLETNNHLAPRIEAIEHFTSRNTEAGPALVIDKQMCPNLCRALAGGWRYEKVKRSSMDDEFKPAPEKNAHSHDGDSFGYLCQYFYKQYKRGTREGANRGSNMAQVTGRAVPQLQRRAMNYFQS